MLRGTFADRLKAKAAHNRRAFLEQVAEEEAAAIARAQEEAHKSTTNRSLTSEEIAAEIDRLESEMRGEEEAPQRRKGEARRRKEELERERIAARNAVAQRHTGRGAKTVAAELRKFDKRWRQKYGGK